MSVNMHAIDCKSVVSTDNDNNVNIAEFAWPSKVEAYSCSSLRPAHKSRQEELKFTFNVSKCDHIFDELHKHGYIKISHVIPALEELKRHAYCKFHNSYSHAINDCKVFCRQVQLAINEGRLRFHDMQVDKTSFPVSTLDLQHLRF
ncbi:hypothetical protein FA727_23880 [Robertmurraya kyonggiensis]|uniref:Uncharacterized protein n=1 Tax=Robertmurraya kyonggiensis TaxID=1037680 RepID=A0A4U1CXS5_9BACI|nr:hypothetical protein FA727_23880 [Robertmurraya kyonggiensis]